VRQQTNDFHLCAEDRLTFLGSRGRDVFRALLNGAAVYPVEIKQEGLAGLADWLIQEEITMYNSVPSAFRHFVHTLTGAEQFPKLRLIKLVGETLYKRDVELYQKHFAPHCILVNSLGVTETGTVRQYFIDKNTHITSSLVPVGYPTDDKEVLLLDEDGNEVGVNQIGEIVVKSRYLSPGYWRRPELTQAKFFPDPAGGEKRLYHTGDLGMLQPDSCLIHLGRTDFQVKIRGNRVEIGEIETALLDLDTVKEAVVVAREDVPGHKRLVAYIVPVNHSVPSVSTLRRALAEKLPDYMIPAAFVLMDTLPLTGIGKVDQRALPAPGNTRSALDTPFMAPRTPLEKTLTTIWTEVLGLEQIGIHDHFLDLGGNSLLATQVISRAITTFQVTLPVQTLFQTPTIADMAVVIMQNQTQAGQEEMAHMLAELEALTEEEAQRLLKEVS
jgi:acyl-coenzyme A synthetase/AMP-(fatty) acid ligase